MFFIGLFVFIINILWTGCAVAYLGENQYRYDFENMNTKQMFILTLFTGPIGWLLAPPVIIFNMAVRALEKSFEKSEK